MSDEKTGSSAEHTREGGAAGLAAGRPKATMEVEAVQIIGEEQTPRKPPPLPRRSPPPPPPPGGRKKGSPPQGAAEDIGTDADSPTADRLPEVGSAINAGAQEKPASAPDQAEAEQFVKKLTAEAEAVGSKTNNPAVKEQAAAGADASAVDGHEPGGEPASEARSTRSYLQSEGGIPWHKLDYREAALLAQVDGRRGRDAVIAAAELDPEGGGELFDGLVERGLICPVDGE